MNHRRFMLAAVAALAFSPLVVASPSGAAPSESDAVAQAVPELPELTSGLEDGPPIRAGAVYFPMFNPGGHTRIVERTEEVYGRPDDAWGGVRDFHDGHPNSEQWPDTDWSHLQPSIGYYDDSDPETVERHITQATSAGLSFFNIYWYWDASTQSERVTGAGLAAFLQADNRDTIDFTVGLCAHPFDNLAVPQEQYGAVADVLVSRYLSQENTLRTADGLKIFTICDARGLGDGSPEQVAGFVDTVRSLARDELGEEIFVMINQAGFDPNQVPAARADGAYCTTDGPAVESQSYADYLAGQRAFFQQAPGAYGRCAMSNFDERPRYPIEQPDPEQIRWFRDHTVDGFRQALRNVRDDIAESTRPGAVDDLVFLYAYNEWHEGGVLEPNARDGCLYLDIVREELGLTEGSGCVETPDATPAPSEPAPPVAEPPAPSTTAPLEREPEAPAAPASAEPASTPPTSLDTSETATGEELPNTGSNTLPMVIAAAALIAVGFGLVVGVRRLRSAASGRTSG